MCRRWPHDSEPSPHFSLLFDAPVTNETGLPVLAARLCWVGRDLQAQVLLGPTVNPSVVAAPSSPLSQEPGA